MLRLKKSVKALKAEDYSNKEVVIEKGEIKNLEEKETEYGKRILMTIEDSDSEEEKNVFLNSESQDNLILAFGDSPDELKGKFVSVVCKKGEGKYKNQMLIVKPIK